MSRDEFKRITAREFHDHIGEAGRQFFAELADIFGDDVPGMGKRLHFENAVRFWTIEVKEDEQLPTL